MKATDIILAGMFAGGGSGGGGGGTSGVLALHSDENATLDKTFREIVEAIDAGKFVFISGVNGEPEEYSRWLDSIVETYYYSGDQKYYVGSTNSNGLYVAASLDDYPTWVDA